MFTIVQVFEAPAGGVQVLLREEVSDISPDQLRIGLARASGAVRETSGRKQAARVLYDDGVWQDEEVIWLPELSLADVEPGDTLTLSPLRPS